MRIAQVAPLYEAVPPTGYSGTERVIAALCDGLVDRGHEVTLFAAGASSTAARLERFVSTPLVCACHDKRWLWSHPIFTFGC